MDENLTPTTDERPWGSFRQFTHNVPSTVKLLKIKPGEAFSLQHHSMRDEFWHVLSGSGRITIGETVHEYRGESGVEFFIPRGTTHRIEATEEEIVVLEISLGDFREDDIVRIEDKYNRN